VNAYAYAGGSAAGTITNQYGVRTRVGHYAGNATINSAFGIHISKYTTSSRPINYLSGIYIDSSITGGVISTYAIYNNSSSPIYTAGDIKLATGKGVYINSKKVLGDRQSAIANVTETGTGEDGEARAKINSILATLRAHGLIES